MGWTVRIFISRLLLFFGGVVLITLFQNCGKKFESAYLTNVASLASTPEPMEPLPAFPEVDPKVLNCETPVSRFQTLDQTCLARAMEKMAQVGPLKNFFEYTPRYPLYSDGAGKKRWIYLPPNTKINTSIPDKWVYPKGTILFKEFSSDDVVVETRMIEKMDDGEGFNSWRFSLFAERRDGSPAERVSRDVLASEVDANTYVAGIVQARYKIGKPEQCLDCHSGPRDVIQGFSYLQLSQSGVSLSISDLINKNLLSNPPTTFAEIPGTTLDKQAIGYIQSNCASCHHGGAGAVAPGNFLFKSDLALFDQPLFAFARARSTLADPFKLIVPGQPSSSRLWVRFDAMEMPRIQLTQKHTEAVDMIKSWIEQLDPTLVP